MLRIRTRNFIKKGNDNFIGKVSNVIKSMENNPNFPDPSPSLQDLQTQLNIFRQMTTEARNGDKLLITKRNDQRSLLTEMIFQEAAYVLNASSGTLDKEKAIIKVESSGFEVVKRKSKRQVVKPSEMKATPTAYTGTVNLQWKSIPGATYLIERTEEDEGSPRAKWMQTGITTRSKITIEGLPSLTYQWFRVIAVFSGGRKSAPSNTVKCVVG